MPASQHLGIFMLAEHDDRLGNRPRSRVPESRRYHWTPPAAPRDEDVCVDAALPPTVLPHVRCAQPADWRVIGPADAADGGLEGRLAVLLLLTFRPNA
jgi:hypothetical protein